MEKTFNEKKYKLEYNSKNYIRIPLDLSIKHDQDIITYLKTLKNRTGKIKELIRKEIKKRAD